MIKLPNRAAIGDALDDPNLDVDLRAAIGRRIWKFYVEQGRPLAEEIRIFAVEGGDLPDVINETVGFPITGPRAEEPSYECVEVHGLWFEIVYARDGDPRTFIFVENNDSTDPGMHYLHDVCFWPADSGPGQ